MAQNQTPLDLPESNEKLKTDQTLAEPTVIVGVGADSVTNIVSTAAPYPQSSINLKTNRYS